MQDTSEIRVNILGVRSMNTTKEHHEYVRASLIMAKTKKKIKFKAIRTKIFANR